MPPRNQRREKPDVDRLLNRFAAEEQAFLHSEFLAPALRGGRVAVRIAGAVCSVRIEPADFEGWGVFQPVSFTQAQLVRRASLAQRRDYLELFPRIRLIVCRRAGDTWFGAAASFGDTRIRLQGLAPLHLAEDVQPFDCVRTRYDGSRFWFDELDTSHDPAATAYLRMALNDRTPPEDLQRRGLTAEERAAYELNYWQLIRPQQRAGRGGRPESELPAEGDLVRRRLRESLSHAGAELIDYLERADGFRVSYVVGGQQFTSSVNKDDLSLQVAGICLAGEDRKFDLGSLVGVLREGEHQGALYQVGGQHGMNEQEYWREHPPTDR